MVVFVPSQYENDTDREDLAVYRLAVDSVSIPWLDLIPIFSGNVSTSFSLMACLSPVWDAWSLQMRLSVSSRNNFLPTRRPVTTRQGD
jgi:hypothetical protein